MEDKLQIGDNNGQIKAYDLICKSPVIIFRWRISPGWPIDFITENVYGLTGYSAKEFTSNEIMAITLIHPEDVTKTENEILRSISKKDECLEIEFRIITKDGKTKHIKSVTLFLYNTDGSINHCQSTIRDMSDEKMAKDKTIKNLKRFKDLIEITKTAYLMMSVDGVIKETNSVFLEMVMCENGKSVIGHNISDLVSKDSVSKIKKGLSLLDKGIAIEDLELCLDNFFCKNKIMWIRFNANIMENGEKNVMCLMHDITSKKIKEFEKYISGQKQKDRVRQNISIFRNKIQGMYSHKKQSEEKEND